MGSLNNKPHAVLLPYPAQGHVNPLMQLARLLHSKGFHVTFVNTEFNHRRLVRSNGPEFFKGLLDFRFETIPDGLPPSDRDATQDIWALSDSVRKNCLDPFRELLAKLNSSPELPPVTCIISDGLMSFAIEAAEELGIPEIQFWTASAIGLMGFLQFEELVKRGIVPFKGTFYSFKALFLLLLFLFSCFLGGTICYQKTTYGIVLTGQNLLKSLGRILIPVLYCS